MKRFICCVVLALTAQSAVAQAKADANTAKIFKGYSLNQLTAAGLLYNPQAKAAYHKALGPLVKEPWLAELDGPSNEFRPVKVAGGDYMLGGTCKNRDCYDNTVVLLWAAPDVVYGKVVQKGKSRLIGSPPPAVSAELERLWKSEFRSQPK